MQSNLLSLNLPSTYDYFDKLKEVDFTWNVYETELELNICISYDKNDAHSGVITNDINGIIIGPQHDERNHIDITGTKFVAFATKLHYYGFYTKLVYKIFCSGANFPVMNKKYFESVHFPRTVDDISPDSVNILMENKYDVKYTAMANISNKNTKITGAFPMYKIFDKLEDLESTNNCMMWEFICIAIIKKEDFKKFKLYFKNVEYAVVGDRYIDSGDYIVYNAVCCAYTKKVITFALDLNITRAKNPGLSYVKVSNQKLYDISTQFMAEGKLSMYSQ